MKPLTRQASLAAVAAALCLAPALAEAQVSPTLDHFWCYGISDQPPAATVLLRDQFDPAGTAQSFAMRSPLRFCNPVAKTTAAGAVTPVTDPDGHLKLYLIPPNQIEPARTVRVRNQFGRRQKLTTFDPLLLAVPTAKNTQPPSEALDHFKCYRASGIAPANKTVRLKDQFQEATVAVLRPLLLCNPVEKSHGTVVTPIKNPAGHLVCYYTTRTALADSVAFTTRNQFGGEQLSAEVADILCVPSRKMSVTPLP